MGVYHVRKLEDSALHAVADAFPREVVAALGHSDYRPVHLAAAAAALAAVILVVSASVLSRWSDSTPATAQRADEAFDDAIRDAGGGPPYMEIAPDGAIRVRRELERSEPVPLDALAVLFWEPSRRRLVRVRFPYWFVRIKFSRTLNLGTFLSLATGSWGQLELRISEEELERLGPGLLLDHRRRDGSRLLMWTE